ncbi:glycosyltransferase family 4 protein [Halopelagius longus]|uniref:Glycosyltransferase family 1 protein n=1 Tax=Halopelagius longus TaxID=1236180 RepID=A0A1H1C752_9EURY|nr:glycosyltransferase family 4 protein [Halopelagius longus]RDI71079.1 glycosyltransferase family 1 protein [Halopelagius longus]SDQ59486.1 Glycosyltransferase involved in cell wall bisynthesis [Halopelagius longus]
MRLLVAAHDFYPDPGSGGSGRYVYETTRRLTDRGHEVSVVTRRRGGVPARETVDGVEVRRYDLAIADRTAPDILPQLPDAARAVEAACEDTDPDVLSLQGPVTGALADRAVPDDVPRSCTFHSPWPTEYLLRTRDGGLPRWRRELNASLRRQLERRLLERADDVVTLSRFMDDQLCGVYGPVHDAAVVPGGVDTETYRPDAGPYDRMEGDDADADGTAFLTVRRLSPRMGHELLLDAFADHASDYPDDRLYVAGDGPLREELEARADRLGVDDRVTFLGYVPDADLPSAYASADAFVLPTTRLEGFGLATLEALSSGTPVVGTPVGGTVEILSECERAPEIPERMLLAGVDEDELAAALGRWSALSATERERAGEACRRYVREQYTWGRTVEARERRYAERVA